MKSFAQNEKGIGDIPVIIGAVVALILIASILLVAMPEYKIWKLDKNGQAQLAEASWTKQIKVEEAKANYESAKINRETELINANTTADTNRIVAGSLDPMFIQYQIATKLTDANTQVVYIPTGAVLPTMDVKPAPAPVTA